MPTELRSPAPRVAFLAAVLVGALLAAPTDPAVAQDAGTSWEGAWSGWLTNYPIRADAVSIEVLREIGPYPAADSTCSTWRTTYAEGGVQRGVKDYRLCRGSGPDDLFVDEGDGIRLGAGWLGDVLFTPFKYGTLLLVAMTRVDGDTMTEEILTANDLPATEGVVPLRPRSLQRLVLRRNGPRCSGASCDRSPDD